MQTVDAFPGVRIQAMLMLVPPSCDVESMLLGFAVLCTDGVLE